MTDRPDDRRWAAAAALLCTCWYAALLTGFSFDLLRPTTFGYIFNSMIEHLAQGRLDVAPDAVRAEGFYRDGRAYAYFGIFPALLRLPLLALPRGALLADLTHLSTLLAAGLGLYWQLRAIGAVAASLDGNRQARRLLAALAACAALGGPQVQFLRASVYQEVTFWAAAFAALFVAAALRGLLGGFTPRLLRLMALAAGLALSTRVSTGLGLYAALGLLLLWRAWPGRLAPRAWLIRLLGPGNRVALLLLAAFLAVTLAVNLGRWGNPFTVADLRLQGMTLLYPGRMARILASGEFAFARIWFGLLYYFLPVCFIIIRGTMIFAEYRQRMVEIELPPASFLATDPLLVLLSALFVARLRAAWRALPGLVALAGGLTLPALLMLGLVFMNFRYRQEFYPFFTATALGTLLLGGGARLSRRAWTLAGLGILAAHATLLLYAHIRFGPADAELVWAMIWRVMKTLGL